MKKYIIAGLILATLLSFAGCKLQIQGPQLSFSDYNIEQKELTDNETDEIIGYEYTATGTIINKGGEGKYIIELHGEGVKIGTYGPVNIDLSQTKSFSLVFETEGNNKYDSLKIKLYAINYYGNKSHQETVEYSVNI